MMKGLGKYDRVRPNRTYPIFTIAQKQNPRLWALYILWKNLAYPDIMLESLIPKWSEPLKLDTLG
jgi:hypothetical protein